MAQSSGVTSVPPRGLTVEVLITGVLFATSAGLTGLAGLPSQRPPSALLLLGWPMFAVVGAVLLDRSPGLRLGRTLAALSVAPLVIVAESIARSRSVEPPALAAAAADLAAPLACTLALAVPWAFVSPMPQERVRRRWTISCAAAAGGAALVTAAEVIGSPAPVRIAGWTIVVVATMTAWRAAGSAVRHTDRASRRRLAWLLVTLASGSVSVAATWLLWPGSAGFYATCGALMIGSLVIARLWFSTDLRPFDEHLLDVGLVLGVGATSAAVTGLVHLGSVMAHRSSNTNTVVFTALLTAAMTAPAALWVRRSVLAARYGTGLIPPEDVAAITADLHAKTEPRDLLDKAARMVASASGSDDVRIVLGDDDPAAFEQWVVHPLEVGGDRVASLLIWSSHPEGLEARQQQVVAQLLPTVALVARAVGLAVETEHARQDVARERDAERRRVMGDLHDGLGPVLAGMSMRVQAALRTADSPEDAALLRSLAQELATGRADLRRIVAGMTPSTLDDGDLERALHGLVESFRSATDTPKVSISVGLACDIAKPVQVAVYRSVAEGITNGLRHAAAATIDVAVQARDGRVVVEVTDDGVGGPVVPGVGLSSLARRAESLGGRMTICAGDPGTKLHLELPVAEAAS